jgi:cyclophilin family peptidyl-prolyl cis-trans isomerase
MSSNPHSALEGTQTVSPIEMLWERYRSLILTVVFAAVAALGLHYGWKYWNQKQADSAWSSFAVTVGQRGLYTDPEANFDSLAGRIDELDLAQLEQAFKSAPDAQKPYLLLALARRAMFEKNWDRAESALQQLEQAYPQHSLVKTTDLPVQARDLVKRDEDKPLKPGEKPEWKPAKAGSAVSLMREQIATARAFEMPAGFEKPAIPADATKVKFELGDYGSFTIALMPQAEKHKEAFLRLAGEAFWVGVAVDEIQRSATNGIKQPRELHFGFEPTKADDRTSWVTTEPSKNIVDYEKTGLSHFAGAVSARPEAEGKSCADRLWINVDDAPVHDGERVVFGYVVEGFEVLGRVAEASMSVQEEERGRGRPTENICVTAVTIL